jgi:O-antigen ligase
MAGAGMNVFVAALVATIAWGTFAFGAVYPWAYWPLAVACAGLGIAGLRLSRHWFQGRTRTLTIALVVVVATIALQLVPLPIGVLRAISPNADRFMAQADLSYAFAPPSWHALSVAPAASAVALALFAAFSVFLLGLSERLPKIKLDGLARTMAIMGAIVAVVGMLNRAAIGDSVHGLIYGFWKPEQDSRPFPPFVNPNHFAGWMVLVIAFVLGYAGGLAERSWQERPTFRRWLMWLTGPEAGELTLALLCVATMATALVFTNSRSGLAAFGLVLCLFGVRFARRVQEPRLRIAIVAIFVGLLVGAMAWAGAQPILDKFAHAFGDTSSADRLGAWRDALHIFQAFPLFGSGLGTFGDMMLAYQSVSRTTYFTQAHNDYLQILAEGGLVVSAAVVALIAVVVAVARYRVRQDTDLVTSWIRFGAIAGLVGMAAQSSVEFSLQMPGITALFTMFLAIAIHRPSSAYGVRK